MKYICSNKEYHSGFREMSFLIANAIIEAQQILDSEKNDIKYNPNREIAISMYQNIDTSENIEEQELSKIKLEKTIQVPMSMYSSNLPGVSVINYICDDIEDLEKIKYDTKRIKFVMAENNIYYFKYQSYSFSAKVYSIGNDPINDTREFYKEISIKSDAPYHIIENLVTLAEDFYNRNFKNMEDRRNKIVLRQWIDGYWDTINTLRPRFMKNIYFPEKDLQDLLKDFDTFLSEKTKSIYFNLNIPYKRNYLLEGRWGTGKTSLIHALSSKYKKNIAIIPFNNKVDDCTILSAISGIPDNSVLVLEDIDCLFQERKKNDENKNQVSFSSILNMLDGLAYKEGLITFMTTNYKTHLDEALIRPGRIDYMIHCGFAKKEQFIKMFYNFSGMSKDNDPDYQDTDKNHFTNFWDNFQTQRIKVTTGLLSQYMLKYINDPEGIIENTDELKKLHGQTNKQSANMHI
jgi:hypothetical protein